MEWGRGFGCSIRVCVWCDGSGGTAATATVTAAANVWAGAQGARSVLGLHDLRTTKGPFCQGIAANCSLSIFFVSFSSFKLGCATFVLFYQNLNLGKFLFRTATDLEFAFSS